MRVDLNHHVWVSVKGAAHRGQVAVYLNLFLSVPLLWLVGLSSIVVWSPSLVVLFLGPIWQDSSAVWYQMLYVNGFGLPIYWYHAIHCFGDWVCVGGSSCAQGLILCILELGQVNKSSKAPCSLPPNVSPSATPEIVWTSSRAFWRKTIEWSQAGCRLQTVPQGTSLIEWVTKVGRMGLVEPLLGGSVVKHWMGRKCSPLQSHTTQFFSSISNSSSLRRSTLQVQFGCNHLS